MGVEWRGNHQSSIHQALPCEIKDKMELTKASKRSSLKRFFDHKDSKIGIFHERLETLKENLKFTSLEKSGLNMPFDRVALGISSSWI